MTFLKTNIDTVNKKEVYRLTKGDSQKIEGLDYGLSIPVEKYALYTEVQDRNKQDGTTEQYDQTVLTFTSGGCKFGTISATFIKSFMEIVELMAGDPFAIIITGGQSKSGRKYVNCELDCDYEPAASGAANG